MDKVELLKEKYLVNDGGNTYAKALPDLRDIINKINELIIFVNTMNKE